MKGIVVAELLTPGERLFNWILDTYKQRRASEDSWIHALSTNFDIDPYQFEDYLMRSSGFMLLRRLLWNASWYERQYGYVGKYELIVIFERYYLRDVLGFSGTEVRSLSRLTFNAVEESQRDITSGLFHSLKGKYRLSDQGCQLCGVAIDYNSSDQDNSFSLDHIWPQSLGGTSDEWNLRVACRLCNSKRKNFVEASDTHYEHFHVKRVRATDEAGFLTELNWDFRMAALLRAGFACEICGKDVDKMDGWLDFLQRNRAESYQMFNIMVACKTHNKSL